MDELVFGDNDQLAAYITHNFDADILTILTDIDGFYDLNPHEHKDAKLQKIVNKIDPALLRQNHSANSEFATGGIVTKLKAADYLIKNTDYNYLNKRLKFIEKGEALFYWFHTLNILFPDK